MMGEWDFFTAKRVYELMGNKLGLGVEFIWRGEGVGVCDGEEVVLYSFLQRNVENLKFSIFKQKSAENYFI